MTRVQSILSGLLIIGFSASAQSITIGAYAVANHSSCGAGNIPGTITELDKFFASKDFPTDATKNFYWKDSRVQQNQWSKDGDYKASKDTASGFDGADSSLLTYIASHGVTSSGVYKALSGSKSNGGCYIPTSSLELGNQASRYTILSTCQGLKVGTGDNPTASGENPSKTWKNAAKGLNCILGYSNNMADADGYGVYLLEKLKDGKTTLAEAFMASSEAVSKENIPAVLCFGSTQADAADYIQKNKSFDTTSRGNAASAFVYRRASTSEDGMMKKSSFQFAPSITVEPVKINPGRVAKAFLGVNVSLDKNQGSFISYSSEAGQASYNAQTNVLQISNNVIEAVRSDDVPAVDEAAEIAANAVKASGLSSVAGELTLAGSSEDVLGGSDGSQRVIQRKFSFKQVLAGFQPLSQAGSVEVAIGPGGAVINVTASLLRVTGKESGFVQSTNISAAEEDLETTAISNVAEKVPGASYKVISTHYGYDAGNFFGVKSQADAVAEVLVEAEQGGFARRYIEKIKL